MNLTIIIIILTSIISLAAFKNYTLIDRFIYSPYLIYKKKQFYRFFSSGFIHGDISHLIFNMFSLYSFGEALESLYLYYYPKNAFFYFLSLYFGGIIFSNLPFFFKHKNNSRYLSVGASGGISAIVLSYILYSPNSIISIFGFINLPSLILVLIYLIYVVYLNTNKIYTRTNHLAHIYGAIYGIVFNIIIQPKLLKFFYFQLKNMF